MKPLYLTAAFLVTVLIANGSASTTNSVKLPDDTAYSVVERGANHCLWEKISFEPGPDGEPLPVKHRYIELASGLNYQDANGQWQESEDVIESYSGGAVARHGQYQVIFANNLNSYDAIDMQTPDGKRLRSNILGLMYHDTASDKAVLIAQLQDTEGELISSNQVLYPDAFNGVKADVRYTYKRGSFEQDVILREQPPAPESYGLDPNTTELEVMTEFINPPKAKIIEKAGGAISGQDEEISWGAMRIGRGKAFDLTTDPGAHLKRAVNKEYITVEGRHFLLEKVEIKEAEATLRKLPRQADAHPAFKSDYARNLVIPPPIAAGEKKRPINFALSGSPASGYVLDYVSLNSSVTNYTFQGDTTYYITGNLNLYGTTTLEGGAVLKYPTNGPAVIVNEGFNCKTMSYHPAVFTSKDDNSVGETISGSSGVPMIDHSYNCYFMDFNTINQVDLHDIRMSYCYCGVTMEYGSLSLRNAQFTHTDYPLYLVFSYCNTYNVLMSDVEVEAFEGFYSTNYVSHLTLDQCVQMGANDYSSTMTLTNCLLTGVSSMGDIPYDSDHVVNLSTNTGVFQTVGGGHYYLAAGSVYRNYGTSNLDATVLQDIASRTTYPPIAYTNVIFTNGGTFSPQAQRDSDIPDLGYHYAPLDYSFGGCEVDSNVTFTAGTAVGWFRSNSGWYHAGQAIRMNGDLTVSFEGTATSPGYWARLTTVQEDDRTAGYGHGSIENWANPPIPTVSGRFLRCTALSGEAFNGYFADDYGAINAEMTHSEFYSGALFTYGDAMYYTNCLMWRVNMGLSGGNSTCARILRNCTFWGGQFGMNRGSSGTFPVSVRDCAFDSTVIATSGDYYGTNPTYTDYDYNSYTNNSDPFSLGGSHDVGSVSSFEWQTDTYSGFGDFYLPYGSPLVDAGSQTADKVGLYHFTTQLGGFQGQETNSIVDIGYHYVALDDYLNYTYKPVDTDNDGILDYLEDANGNGVVDNGETDWQSAQDLGLRVFITMPPTASQLP